MRTPQSMTVSLSMRLAAMDDLRYPAGLAGDGTFELKTAGPTFLEEFVVVNGFH